MASFDDLYLVLGVDPHASVEQIRQAYRRRARQSHPDVAGPASAAAFVRVRKAYETLVDPDRRQAYDRQRRVHGQGPMAWRQSGRGAPVARTRWMGSPLTLGSMLCDLVADLCGPAAHATYPHAEVQALHVEVVLSPELVQGGELTLELPVTVICRHCEGTGTAEPFICPACRGRGRWPDVRHVRLQLHPPVRDGQVVTVDLRSGDMPVGVLHAHLRLSWF